MEPPEHDPSSPDDAWTPPGDDLGPAFGHPRDDDWRPPPLPDDRLWRHPSELVDLGVEPRRDPPPVVTVALLAGLVGSVFTAAIVTAFGGIGERVVEVVEREQVPMVAPASTAAGAISVVDIAETLRPSIVRIEVETMGGSGSGSGVIFRDNGYVLTNAHVVAGTDRVNVVLSDGREHEAVLVGTDEESDIAVVRMDRGPYTPAVLGNATQLRVGEAAIAIGSPLGLRGGPSVTVGVISAVGRSVANPAGRPLLDMIQTDAPIAPGSSGGALLDHTGAVIGITTAIAVSDVGAEGLGFATPIDVARAVADDLITDGVVRRAWLGIEGMDLSYEAAEGLGIAGGALVDSVVDDSPAQRSGLADGDVIVGLDGVPVESMSGLVLALRAYRPDDVVVVDIVRDGKAVTVEVSLDERPDDL